MRFAFALSFSALALSAVATVSCGGGYSEERANQVCTEERKARGGLFTDETFSGCVACYEECGDQCEVSASVPYVYACAEGDSDEGAGGGG